MDNKWEDWLDYIPAKQPAYYAEPILDLPDSGSAHFSRDRVKTRRAGLVLVVILVFVLFPLASWLFLQAFPARNGLEASNLGLQWLSIAILAAGAVLFLQGHRLGWMMLAVLLSHFTMLSIWKSGWWFFNFILSDQQLLPDRVVYETWAFAYCLPVLFFTLQLVLIQQPYILRWMAIPIRVRLVTACMGLVLFWLTEFVLT